MSEVYVLAIDLAKRSFQVCGIDRSGAILFNRSVSRAKLEQLVADHPPCIVAMEACATSHHWGRIALRSRHEVRLIPPIYVKPFVKRQKNDRADAEAIAEAALRPQMRFVAVKSAEKQGRAVRFRTHQCLVRQRTQLINALRGHLAEFGMVAPTGPGGLKSIETLLEREGDTLPETVRAMAGLYLEQIGKLAELIAQLTRELKEDAARDEELKRLQTIPGIGPVTAGAVAAFAPDLKVFASGRNFAAWLGLVPKQRSTGGKTRLGAVSKMGQCDIRRLLIVGAMSVIRWVARKGPRPDSWIGRLLMRKPRMVAAVALANKMARMIWAVMTRQEDYRMPEHRGFAPA